jgi:hypothetical protein
MDLIPKKYFLFVLAAFLVVALGYMAVKTSRVYAPSTINTNQDLKQDSRMNNGSDDLESIEKDVVDTDYSGINEDLEQMSKELDSE